MIKQVNKTRSSLNKAEEAGRSVPKLNLNLRFDPDGPPIGQTEEEMDENEMNGWNDELGYYRLYLVRGSFEPTEADEEDLVRYVDFYWSTHGWRNKDRICGKLLCSDDPGDEVPEAEIPEFACPRLASTETIHPCRGVAIVFLSEDHIEVTLRSERAWLSRRPPVSAPQELRFVGVLRLQHFPAASGESSPQETWFNLNIQWVSCPILVTLHDDWTYSGWAHSYCR
ncbi:hypothetical protein F5Y16DRAFT_385546 [Xylariaceae sp. FL0255]|nr:hypothetical protein F5Y16DRAFT_385546 [Xylariaceae sp. FL0255]